jgi:hypothetical protein
MAMRARQTSPVPLYVLRRIDRVGCHQNERARFDFVNFSFLSGVSPQARQDGSVVVPERAEVPGITLRAMVFAQTKVRGCVEPGDRAGPNVAAPRKMTLSGCCVAGGNGDETGANCGLRAPRHDCWRRIVRCQPQQRGFQSLLPLLSHSFF